MQVVLRVALLSVLPWLLPGCRVPEGTTAQTSGMGLELTPLGEAPQAPKLRFGSFASQFSLPVPPDAGASVNRSDLAAPLGVRQTATQALGAVGREFQLGGAQMVGAIEALHPPAAPQPIE